MMEGDMAEKSLEGAVKQNEEETEPPVNAEVELKQNQEEVEPPVNAETELTQNEEEAERPVNAETELTQNEEEAERPVNAEAEQGNGSAQPETTPAKNAEAPTEPQRRNPLTLEKIASRAAAEIVVQIAEHQEREQSGTVETPVPTVNTVRRLSSLATQSLYETMATQVRHMRQENVADYISSRFSLMQFSLIWKKEHFVSAINRVTAARQQQSHH